MPAPRDIKKINAENAKSNPVSNTKPEPGWWQTLLDSFPDFAASKGIPPPASPPPPATANNTVAAAPIPEPLKAPSIDPKVLPPPVAAAPPVEAAVSQPPVGAPNPNEQMGAMTGGAPELFPTESIQPTAQDIADATANQIGNTSSGNSPSRAALGAALSGVKAPAVPQYQTPNAPGLPATHQLQSNLFDILRAAGLAAPQPQGGLNFRNRL